MTIFDTTESGLSILAQRKAEQFSHYLKIGGESPSAQFFTGPKNPVDTAKHRSFITQLGNLTGLEIPSIVLPEDPRIDEIFDDVVTLGERAIRRQVVLVERTGARDSADIVYINYLGTLATASERG